MSLTLNTSHPLYANIVSLICVDDNGAIKDLKNPSYTFTVDAAVTYGTGALGRHFRTARSGANALGVKVSSLIPFGTTAAPNGSVFVALNSVRSVSAASVRNSLLTQDGFQVSATPTILINATGNVGQGQGYSGVVDTLHTTASVSSGAHSIIATRTSQTSCQILLDGGVVDTPDNGETLNLGRNGNNDPTCGWNYIGGFASGDWGAVSADFVWIVTLDKVLSAAEAEALDASLGASNAFGLIEAGANAAPTFSGPNIGAQSGTVGVALTGNNIASKFSDTDALTFSAVGTWPAGVTVSSAGIISGTPTTAGTYSALKVRATDTAAQTIDSDAFSFTIAVAVAGTITTPALKNNTGTVLAGETGITVNIYHATTGALIVQKTGLTSNASGVIVITDALLVAGTSYAYEPVLSGSRRRLPVVAAS